MDIVRTFGEQVFASLSVRNYRLYFAGIGISQVGTWMQIVALGWLVLELTGSGTQLGAILALRFIPLLLGSLHAGALVDRIDKRTLLYVTQSISAALAVTLGTLVFFDVVAMWMLYVAAVLFGCTDVIDRPARQTFIHEMVGPERLRNAVALNSTEVNLARALGPLFAGVLIASAGTVLCFFANAISYLIFLVFLVAIREKDLHREFHEERKVDHLFSGLYYVTSTPLLLTVLVTMAVVGTLAYEFQTTLPLFAHTTFLGSAADYAAFLSAMGAGSVAGGLFSASRGSINPQEFALWAFLFGLSLCITALSPTLGLATVGMVFVGFFSICLTSTGNTMIQLESASHMRGRVMSLWTMAIFGSTVIGAPIVGFIGEHASPRWALILGGFAGMLAAIFAARRLIKAGRFFFIPIPAFIFVRREEAAVENART